MRKNRFLSFCFSFMPGAGQMYLGLLKRGVSLMSLFFFSIFFVGFTKIDLFGFAIPVVWFYAFFDSINLSGMPYEKLIQVEDKYLFDFDKLLKNDYWNLFEKRHIALGTAAIVIGVYMIFHNFVEPYIRDIEWLRNLINRMPSLLFAIAIIALGLYLIMGKKQNDEFKDFKEFEGDKNERV